MFLIIKAINCGYYDFFLEVEEAFGSDSKDQEKQFEKYLLSILCAL